MLYRHARAALTALALSGIMTTTLATAPADAVPVARAAHQAQKAKPFSLTWNADATTTVKKLGTEVAFPTTQFTGTIKPLKRKLSGPLALPPAKTAAGLGDLDLVHITMEVADASPVKGTIDVDDTVWSITAKQSFAIHITKVSGVGDLINLVKDGCGTARTTATLSGTVDFAKIGQPGGPGDYTMAGAYSIPEFTGCGALMDSVLTSLVSGPDNPLSVHFTEA
ncbi:hypothetical protein [Nocardioides mangrovi]|uniref:Cyclase n=1 Tax=Nocardioides mangrovi TaxID=2874580 RepID=A0ABS7U6L5_9ACTN|nr:hypothetical protein [Nocardioides mangrovi]MBZ5736623.1 hypothetical protein [Nocardioides mangrovi]